MFGFPKKERIDSFRFKNNLLQTVTFQVRYPQNPAIVSDIDYWKKELGDEYPNLRKIMKGEIKLELTEKTPIIHKPTSKSVGLEIRTKDDSRVITIAEDCLTFTIAGKGYSNFRDIYPQFHDRFIPKIASFGSSKFERIAIRKVNLIGFELTNGSLPYEGLSSFFNQKMVDSYSFIPGAKFINKCLSQISFANEPFKLNIIYGLMERVDESLPYQLLLDVDLYKIEKSTEHSELRGEMKAINDEIFNIFNWAIKDEFLETLR